DRVPRELFAKRLPGRPRLVHLRHAVNAHAAMLAAQQAPAPAPASVAAMGEPALPMSDDVRKVVAEIVGALPASTPAPAPPPQSPLLAMLEHELRKDRKSTRLNSSHRTISYAVFCLKKKTKKQA